MSEKYPGECDHRHGDVGFDEVFVADGAARGSLGTDVVRARFQHRTRKCLGQTSITKAQQRRRHQGCSRRHATDGEPGRPEPFGSDIKQPQGDCLTIVRRCRPREFRCKR